MSDAIRDLREHLGGIYDLQRALGVLRWDQQVMMPAQGAAGRAEAAGTLAGIAHERFVADETGRLLEQASALEDGFEYDSDEAALIRITRREWEKERRVPAELRAEWTREAGKTHIAWLEARELNDFGVFCPRSGACTRSRSAGRSTWSRATRRTTRSSTSTSRA